MADRSNQTEVHTYIYVYASMHIHTCMLTVIYTYTTYIRSLWTLFECVLPTSHKRSILVPVHRAEGLNLANPINSGQMFSFLSKIIENIVASQLTHYLDKNGFLTTYQSGFRKGHSTETLPVHAPPL